MKRNNQAQPLGKNDLAQWVRHVMDDLYPDKPDRPAKVFVLGSERLPAMVRLRPEGSAAKD